MVVAGQAILDEPISIADAAGDEFEAAVHAHARHIYKVAYSVLRNHHDAEDATQETYLRFLKQRKRWPEIRDRRAWLARTAWRVALDRRRRDPEVGIEEALSAVLRLRARGANAEEIVAHAEMRALLRHMIDALPHDLREVLALSTVEEMTSGEISDVLGIPEGSVRTRLMRARELLREKLSALLERKHGR